MTPICGLCKKEARGSARINGVRYCHSDDEHPSCYEQAMWAKNLTRRPPRYTGSYS